MHKSSKYMGRFALRTGAASFALGIALISTPSFAQSAPAAAPTEPAEEIVVTGSIVRNPAAATASPVVSLTSQDLSSRGIVTVTDALQLLTANGGGTNPPSWSSNGFASGASAPSLRGLNDAYTLTLFDGLRTAPYPLADDGYRTFVDINSIPGAIVNRTDILLDGGSATYGSDAIAGVVNIITKKQVVGLHLDGSAGISSRGDAGEGRIRGTFGYGDLKSQGFNVYVSGEYQHNDPLYMRQRNNGPWSTSNWSSVCNDAGSCLANSTLNGIQAGGGYNGFVATTVPFVRAYDANGAIGNFQMLNPAAGCGNLQSVTLSAAQHTAGAPDVVCQLDPRNAYQVYSSKTERKGGTFRGTVEVGSNAEAWFMFNYYNVKTDNPFRTGPSNYTGSTTPPDIGNLVAVGNILLPVYVCPQGVGTIGTIAGLNNALTGTGCNATNGTLNPNNPFAAAGQYARLQALNSVPRETLTNSQLFRWSGGISGTIWDGLNYNLQGTTSKSKLEIEQKGYIFLKGLMSAVATGSYNFADPSKNSQEATDSIFPVNVTNSWSKLTQIQLSFDKDLFQLPGGNLNVAVLGEYRFEAIHNPSANPGDLTDPTARYYGINAVGVEGSRRVWSGAYEISAPILPMLKAKASGSYNTYSTGQSAFSPKFEAQFQPIDQVKLRGTWSKGFRAPSFAESFSLPTTGYQSATINCSQPAFQAFCAAHAGSPDPGYLGTATYSYGLTSGGNPNLKPEKSQAFTLGAVIQPTSRITFTVDYWQTKISNVIIPVSASADVFNQYYANNGAVNIPGIQVVPAPVGDVNNPNATGRNALPLLGFVIGSYKNADRFLARGIDFSGSASVPINQNLTWSTQANASLLLRLQQTLEDGTVQRYDASLGGCNVTSCSGSPKWRVTWQNTLSFNDRASISLTAYYTSGYSQVATDSGGVYGDCQASVDNGQIISFPDGSPLSCRAKSVFYMDAHAETKIGDRFTIYADMKNIFDRKPAFDPNAAYALYGFNPAWSDSLFIGRYMRVGARVDF